MRMIKFLYLVVALMLMVSTAAVAAESPNYFRPGTYGFMKRLLSVQAA